MKDFVKRIASERGLPEGAVNAAGGKIFTFGSYRLGVHGPGSDIDTLCVVPRHVSREDFFETFEKMLREMDGVTEVSVRGPRSGSGLVSSRISKGCSRGLCAYNQVQNLRNSN